MKKLCILFSAIPCILQAQLTPEITSWKINLTGATGYDGIESNVQQVQYSDDYVYVSCSSIPDYDIGPWPGNPNIPSDQNFVFKITRHPEENSGTKTATPLGHIGVWSNGVSMFNPMDAMSYAGMNIWHQNAIIVEGDGFDDCLGHPAPGGEYHHHLNPTCLYDDEDSTHHSPIIGYAFDGFPIYGAYAYANADGTGEIKRMRSSYQLRSITQRHTLPDGTTLSASEYGPDISATYPLSYYVEDFEYVDGLGDLDVHNGRFCVTPEYPAGVYAYFITIDANLFGVYPYTLGPEYYGVVTPGNTGPGSGHNTITESVQTYTTGIHDVVNAIDVNIFPNPASESLGVFIAPVVENNFEVKLYDVQGNVVFVQDNLQPSVKYTFNISELQEGVYMLHLSSENTEGVKLLEVIR